MVQDRALLDRFLVEIFHDILHLEGRFLSRGAFRRLSITEMHVIEAACSTPPGQPDSMAALAARLRVSAGSLTVSVKTLEQKGYLIRQRDTADRRRVLVLPTRQGMQACSSHRQFHQKLIRAVEEKLSPPQLHALAEALEALHRFFGTL